MLFLDFVRHFEFEFEQVRNVFQEDRDDVVVATWVTMEAQPGFFGRVLLRRLSHLFNLFTVYFMLDQTKLELPFRLNVLPINDVAVMEEGVAIAVDVLILHIPSIIVHQYFQFCAATNPDWSGNIHIVVFAELPGNSKTIGVTQVEGYTIPYAAYCAVRSTEVLAVTSDECNIPCILIRTIQFLDVVVSAWPDCINLLSFGYVGDMHISGRSIVERKPINVVLES